MFIVSYYDDPTIQKQAVQQLNCSRVIQSIPRRHHYLMLLNRIDQAQTSDCILVLKKTQNPRGNAWITWRGFEFDVSLVITICTFYIGCVDLFNVDLAYECG